MLKGQFFILTCSVSILYNFSMFKVGDEAKKVLEKNIGLKFDQIYELNPCDEALFVKEKTGKNLYFTKKTDSRKVGRGSPFLAQNKITTMEEINKKINVLCK